MRQWSVHRRYHSAAESQFNYEMYIAVQFNAEVLVASIKHNVIEK